MNNGNPCKDHSVVLVAFPLAVSTAVGQESIGSLQWGAPGQAQIDGGAYLQSQLGED